MKYRRLPGDDDTWFIEDTDINISEFLTTKLEVPQNYSLHSHWLAIEGKVPNIPENEGENVEDIINEKAVESEVDIKHQLSLEQQIYYNTVLEALSTGHKLEGILESLKNDSSLNRLIPYITRSMFALVMESETLDTLERGVKILEALSLNSYINLEPYLHQIVPTLLSALMRADLLDDRHWAFRKNASKTIAKVCEHFNDYYEDLEARVRTLYVKVLQDFDKHPVCHYAAVQGISAFGTICVKNLLVPLLSEYFNELDRKLQTKEYAMWNMCKTAIIVKEN